MLILWKFYNVVSEFSQLQIGEAVVAEVLQQARAAGGRLVAYQRAYAYSAHSSHAHAHTAYAHASAHQFCKHTHNWLTYSENKLISIGVINVKSPYITW